MIHLGVNKMLKTSLSAGGTVHRNSTGFDDYKITEKKNQVKSKWQLCKKNLRMSQNVQDRI